MKSFFSRSLVVLALLAALFAIGFVARAAARVETSALPITDLPFQLAPLVALPLVHVLLNP